MIVVKEGSITKEQKLVPIWIGQRIDCPCCGFRGTLEESDKSSLIFVQDQTIEFIGKRTISITCPTPDCNTKIIKVLFYSVYP